MANQDADKKAEVPALSPTPKPQTQTAVSGRTIEEYRDELGTDPATFAGVKVREGWAAQQRVTKRQYETAVAKFVNGPTVLREGE